MKSYKYFTLFLLGLFVLSACEDVVDLPLPESEPQLVVEGFLTDKADAANYVKLSQSGPYTGAGELPAIAGASVILFDENAAIDTLQEDPQQPGFYPIDLVGRIGGTYYLEITTTEGETYRTIPEQLHAAPAIDTIFAEFDPAIDDDDEDSYDIFLTATDIPGERNFYRWRFYRNDTLYQKPEGLSFSDDVILDGNQVVGFQINPEPVFKGDKIRVEQLSITEAYYEYIFLLFDQTAFPGGLFDTPPAPIKGNVYLLDKPEQPALGYFAVVGLSDIEFVVE